MCLLILIISLLFEQLFQELNCRKDLQAGKLSWSHITESFKFYAINCALPRNSAACNYINYVLFVKEAKGKEPSNSEENIHVAGPFQLDWQDLICLRFT